jgi:hypothetical protein
LIFVGSGIRSPCSLTPPIAFVTRVHELPGLELRINFGMFAGREATAAEIDELGQLILEAAPAVSVFAENRHEMTQESEAALHQVRVELSTEDLPSDHSLLDDLERQLILTAERWARDCIAERHVEVEP